MARWSRRRLITHGSGLLGALALPRRLRASPLEDGGLKVVFVMSHGGWDPTRVFAPAFDNRSVATEDDATVIEAGSLQHVSHVDRPSVDAFFADHADRSVILNGILVPSVAHPDCTRLIMTGSTRTGGAGWPAIMGSAASDRYRLPHVVVSGPGYTGDVGGAVIRVGSSGQLEGLVRGDLIDQSDLPVALPSRAAEAAMDASLAERLAAMSANDADGLGARAEQAARALDQAGALKDLKDEIEWRSGESIGGQLELAVAALSTGATRCVMVSSELNAWDTHLDNDDRQSALFEELFSSLRTLMDGLAATAGTSEASLLDETLVVVLSEMGRTPAHNSSGGKDHWPYSSALLCGPRLAGGQVFGSFSDLFYGTRLDLETGLEDAQGLDLDCAQFGATVLRLAGVDLEDWTPDATGLSAAIAD